jgi:hypothetical protein
MERQKATLVTGVSSEETSIKILRAAQMASILRVFTKGVQ